LFLVVAGIESQNADSDLGLKRIGSTACARTGTRSAVTNTGGSTVVWWFCQMLLTRARSFI